MKLPDLFCSGRLLLSHRGPAFEMVSRSVREQLRKIDIFNPRNRSGRIQVVLAVRHECPQMAPQAYTAICQRADPIEIEDARSLGLETTVFYWREI